jgi:hypothetical protein
MKRFPACALCVLFAALALGLSGCGDDRIKTVPVKGTVTYKGKPVPNGTVMFTPLAGGPTATGELHKNGTYTLTTYKHGDGAAVGQYKVVVVAMEDTSNRLPEDRNPLPPPIVPDKYTSIATTDLQADVRAGDNVCDFELKDPKKP